MDSREIKWNSKTVFLELTIYWYGLCEGQEHLRGGLDRRPRLRRILRCLPDYKSAEINVNSCENPNRFFSANTDSVVMQIRFETTKDSPNNVNSREICEFLSSLSGWMMPHYPITFLANDYNSLDGVSFLLERFGGGLVLLDSIFLGNCR